MKYINHTRGRFLWMPFLLLALAACKKDDGPAAGDKQENRLPQVIADNFNLKLFNAAVSRGNLLNTLSGPGPFTVLAPSDAAFATAGYADPLAIMTASQADIIRIANYHVLNGNYDLNKMPFLFNQEISSLGGGKLFITHWIKGTDTVLTVNGSRVLAQGIGATNGQLQVIDRMLLPYTYTTLKDAMAAETSLTLFFQAVQRAGLADVLAGAGPYTIYAPNNAAMQAMGYATVQDINAADPGAMASLVRYHIAADRRFVYDYILTAGPSNTSTQTMLDENTAKVILVPDVQAPTTFAGISLQGPGNSTPAKLVRQNIVTGNGVLHIIDQVLKITQ